MQNPKKKTNANATLNVFKKYEKNAKINIEKNT